MVPFRRRRRRRRWWWWRRRRRLGGLDGGWQPTGGRATGGSRRGPLSTQNCAQGWRRGRPAVVALKSITGAVLCPGAPRHGTGTAREWPRNGTGTAQERHGHGTGTGTSGSVQGTALERHERHGERRGTLESGPCHPGTRPRPDQKCPQMSSEQSTARHTASDGIQRIRWSYLQLPVRLGTPRSALSRYGARQSHPSADNPRSQLTASQAKLSQSWLR